MKIRSGFVSNSSSSSYVVCMNKATFDFLNIQLNEVQQDMLAFVSNRGATRNFLGNEIVVISWMSGNDDTFENYTFGDGHSGEWGFAIQREAVKEALLKENPDATVKDLEEAYAKLHSERYQDYYDEWKIVYDSIAKLPKDQTLIFKDSF